MLIFHKRKVWMKTRIDRCTFKRTLNLAVKVDIAIAELTGIKRALHGGMCWPVYAHLGICLHLQAFIVSLSTCIRLLFIVFLTRIVKKQVAGEGVRAKDTRGHGWLSFTQPQKGCFRIVRAFYVFLFFLVGIQAGELLAAFSQYSLKGRTRH